MKLAKINTEPEYELDTVLGIIIDEQEKRTKESNTHSFTNHQEDGTPFEDYEISAEIRLADYDQLEPILEQLLINGYLHCNDKNDAAQNKLYYATFKGRKFIADGGYQEEKRRKNEEKARIISLEEHHKQIETSIFYLTVILAAVGIIDAVLHVLEIGEKDKTIYSFVCTAIPAFLITSCLWLFWNFNRKIK